MRAVELVERKRDGGRLSADEILWLIQSYTNGSIPDYQMSAMLMAVFFKGLDEKELFTWMDAMLESGEKLELSAIDQPKVDKHSTGGVGDKVSICLGPLVAACGVAVPMVSGRGLAHSGGTLDKLESIPGFNTTLEPLALREILSKTGLVFAGQSRTLVPADRKLYALRDATATVPAIPLMASSIMSKKMAEDLDCLVLDVKVGSGAFLKNIKQAERLAKIMVAIGGSYGVKTVALITDMNTPIGREVGNANEITEAISVLKGEGPGDLTKLTYALGAEMLLLAGIAEDQDDARARLQGAVDSGAALETFARVIEAQGGNANVIDTPSLLPGARHIQELAATESGTVTGCDALQVGLAAMILGAGRETKEDKIDPAVSVTLLAKPGDPIEKGQALARVACNDLARLPEALRLLGEAWTISQKVYERPPLIKARISSALQ